MSRYRITISWSNGDEKTFEAELTDIELFNMIDYYTGLGVNIIAIPIIEPTPTPEPTPPPESVPEPITPSIIIDPIGFKIENNRIIGAADFISSGGNFSAVAIMRARDQNNIDIVVKTNNLNYTDAEKSERIFYDENAFESTQLEIKLFVWKSISNQVVLAETESFIITKDQPSFETPITPTPRKSKTFMEALEENPLGFIGGIGFIALIANAIRGDK